MTKNNKWGSQFCLNIKWIKNKRREKKETKEKIEGTDLNAHLYSLRSYCSALRIYHEYRYRVPATKKKKKL